MHARLWLFAGLLILGTLSPLGAQQPWAMPPTGGQYAAPGGYWPPGPGAGPYAMPGNYGYQTAGYMAPQGYPMAPQGYQAAGYPPGAGGPVQLAQATAPLEEEVLPGGATNVAEDGTVYVGPDGQVPSDGYEQPAVPGFNSHAPVYSWQPPPTGTRLRSLLPGPYQGLGAQDGCGSGLFGDKLVSRLGHIYVKADVLLWRRTNPGGSTTLVQEGINPVTGATPGNVLETTGSFQMKNEVGQRITLGISQTERSNIEVTYWSFQNSLATTGAVQTGNLFIGGPAGTFPPPLATIAQTSSFANADSFQTAYSTTIWNAEANYLATSVFDKFIFLGGFRTIQLEDHLSLLAQNSIFGPGLFDLKMHNEMYGGQIGFMFRQNFDLLMFEITSKSGVYNDHATYHNFVAGETQGVFRDMGTSSNAAAFVQEFSFNATYHFTSAFAIRLGYQVMWLDNMALAVNNINLTADNTTIPTIQRAQNLFLYGGNLGLEARF